MKIKRCLKLLFRQTLYALFTACRDIVGCPRCCCCCAVVLLCCCCRVSGKFVCAYVNVFLTLLFGPGLDTTAYR